MAAALVTVAVTGSSAIVVVLHILTGAILGCGAFDDLVEFAPVEPHASALWAVDRSRFGGGGGGFCGFLKKEGTSDGVDSTELYC